MTDNTDNNALKDHVVTIDIMVPVETAWAEITKTGRIQKALYNTVLESTLEPGAKLRYYSPNKKRVFVVGEVVEIEPPSKLVHTYMFTTRPEQPSLVTWELAAIDGGCRITLTHSGWTDQIKTHKGVGKGWLQILGILKRELETGDIAFGTKLMYGIMNLFTFMLPKSTKVEEIEKAGW